MKTYEFLCSNFPNIFNDDCWTSKMRSKRGLPAFTGSESCYSDFTLRGMGKEFSEFLRDRGVPYSDRWADSNMTFHLEVKSTTGTCNEPFYMSYNQQNLVSMSIDSEKHEMANHHSLGPGALKGKTGLLRMFILSSVCSISTRNRASIYI